MFSSKVRETRLTNQEVENYIRELEISMSKEVLQNPDHEASAKMKFRVTVGAV